MGPSRGMSLRGAQGRPGGVAAAAGGGGDSDRARAGLAARGAVVLCPRSRRQPRWSWRPRGSGACRSSPTIPRIWSPFIALDRPVSPISPVAPSSDAGTVTVELVADPSCPWCYVGFRRLQRLAREAPLALVWRPFLLNPGLPAGGVSRGIYRLRKVRHRRGGAAARPAPGRGGAAEGIAFAFDRIARTPPTLAAQGLMVEAQRRGVAETAAERLFAAHFVEGRDIDDPVELAAEAQDWGSPGAWQDRRQEPPHMAAVLRSHQQAVASGVTGVPHYVFRPGISIAGAQPIESLRGLLELAQLRLAPDPAAAG